MTDGLTDLAPMAAALFLGLCLLWLVWRALRRLVAAPRSERQEPAFQDSSEPVSARREPALHPVPPPPHPNVPDAADILALKASIDALTKQIASLERRLTPANSNVPPVEKPAPKPSPVDVLADVPLVVPERRT